MPNPVNPQFPFGGAYRAPGAGPTPARGTGWVPPGGGMDNPNPSLQGLASLPTLPPKPDQPFHPIPFQTPTPTMPEPQSGGGSMYPSGFDRDHEVSGSMSGMSRMNPSDAVAGLKGMDYPELERIRLAGQMSQQGYGMGQGTGAPSIGIANGIVSDVDQSLAPQRAQTQHIQQALAAQHPAVAGLAERSALQHAYPQRVEAQGRVDAADIAADADVKGKGMDAASHQNTAMRGQFEHIVKAMTEARKIMATQGLPAEQILQAKQDYDMWNKTLMGLSQSGGLF